MQPFHPTQTGRFTKCLFQLVIFTVFELAALGQTAGDGTASSFAGDLVFRFWGTQQGLPQKTVNSVVQTRDGYLWVGTFEGLARFDGVRFTTFGLSEGLHSVDIRVLLQDRSGVLWIGTSGGGLSRMREGRIDSVPLPLGLAGSENITALAEDAAGRLWIGTRAGLAIYDGNRFITNAAVNLAERHRIRAIMCDRLGTMWIATLGAGLLECDGEQVAECLGPEGIEQIRAYCLLEDQSGNLWASIGNGQVLCRRSGAWVTYDQTDGLPFEYVTCLIQDSAGTVWLGSLDHGLYRFIDGRFEGIQREDGLSSGDILCLLSDRENNLWVGTRTGGLNRLRHRQFITYGPAQGLTNDFTRSVAQTRNGDLWVGTIGGGLYRGVNGRFARTADEGEGPRHAFVYSVLATKDGSIWYGANLGLFRSKAGIIEESFVEQPWLRADSVVALCEDVEDGLWVGTLAGRLFHFKDGQFSRIPGEVARGAITALAQQSNGYLWVGSDGGGLKRLRLGDENVLAVTNGLTTRSIRTLHLDQDGSLWIGTTGGGLGLWRNGRVVTFTTLQGLGTDTISQIIEDDDGDLWLGTSRGIFRVSKSDLEALVSGRLTLINPRSYGINEGMPDEECSSGFSPAGLKTHSGLLCFSTVRGLVLIDPREMEINAIPPDVLLEEVRVDGQPLDLRSTELGQSKAGAPDSASVQSPSVPRVIIPPSGREIEFDYTAISFAAPEKTRFRYRLVGVDSGWIEAGIRRSAYYHGIPVGEYEFQVMVCSADSHWSQPVIEAVLTVKPYLWETAWFRAVGGLAAFGLLAGIVRLVERRRYKRRLAWLEALHAVQRERLRISQDMHDHVGAMLTQVSMSSDLGQSESEKQPHLKGHFERIGGQARAAVQALDEIVWATNPRNDNLPRFAEYIGRFADECFEVSPIRCWQDVPTNLPNEPLRADVRHNVFSAVKEVFNNVLKHSGATEVTLRIDVEETEVVLTIKDNGRGFQPGDPVVGSYGLENIRMRLAECGGQTELKSTPGKGTRVRLRFPIRQQA